MPSRAPARNRSNLRVTPLDPDTYAPRTIRMRGIIYIAIGIACASSLVGCGAKRHDGASASRPAPPLRSAFLQRPDLIDAAEWYAGRAEWPTAYGGFIIEDESTSVEIEFDDQSFFDRFGGGYYRTSQAVRVRTRSR